LVGVDLPQLLEKHARTARRIHKGYSIAS
jgi:hypothetical protein